MQSEIQDAKYCLFCLPSIPDCIRTDPDADKQSFHYYPEDRTPRETAYWQTTEPEGRRKRTRH